MTISALENKISFYQSMKSFKDFSTVLQTSNYSDVPKDWLVLLTDVKGSTKAIEKGLYKQVNMMGAASITCVLNCLGKFEIPYVFGGDGATLLIPPEALEIISAELEGLQAISINDLEIELRVGFVPLQLLFEQNFMLKVAKYELSPGNYLAQFRGGAIGKAEEMVKGKLAGAIILNPSTKASAPNLEGLSCRLNPLQSRRGQIHTLICKSRTDLNPELVLQDILNDLHIILGEDFISASPVSVDQLSWRLLSPTLNDEIQLSRKQNGYWPTAFKLLFKTLLVNFSLKMNFRLGPFLPKKYKSEMIVNSDFKKFDEVLRMVIDCTQDQSAKIENLMRVKFDQKLIYYGIHKSPAALMTCMVFSASKNKHIHFIDGSHGGYAFAAADMKKQIASQT